MSQYKHLKNGIYSKNLYFENYLESEARDINLKSTMDSGSHRAAKMGRAHKPDRLSNRYCSRLDKFGSLRNSSGSKFINYRSRVGKHF